MKRRAWKILLAAIASLVLVSGCTSTDAPEAPMAVDSDVLDVAVAVIDSAYGVLEALNNGWPDYAVEDAFTAFDGWMLRLERKDGPSQMPEFYAAMSNWRSLLDEIGVSSSEYTESRQTEQLNEEMAAAEAALDAALDAAGR